MGRTIHSHRCLLLPAVARHQPRPATSIDVSLFLSFIVSLVDLPPVLGYFHLIYLILWSRNKILIPQTINHIIPFDCTRWITISELFTNSSNDRIIQLHRFVRNTSCRRRWLIHPFIFIYLDGSIEESIHLDFIVLSTYVIYCRYLCAIIIPLRFFPTNN